jgi:hypothetical protein
VYPVTPFYRGLLVETVHIRVCSPCFVKFVSCVEVQWAVYKAIQFHQPSLKHRRWSVAENVSKERNVLDDHEWIEADLFPVSQLQQSIVEQGPAGQQCSCQKVPSKVATISVLFSNSGQKVGEIREVEGYFKVNVSILTPSLRTCRCWSLQGQQLIQKIPLKIHLKCLLQSYILAVACCGIVWCD